MADHTDQLTRLTAAVAERYRIMRELGQGGMAVVYLAEDLKHHRQVAVKVLRPELSAVLGGERFLKEIDVTANLQHPNILAPLGAPGACAWRQLGLGPTGGDAGPASGPCIPLADRFWPLDDRLSRGLPSQRSSFWSRR